MDAVHFDSLTRSLSAIRSRRGALSALLGATVGLFGLTEAMANKKKKKKRRKHKPSCNGELGETLCGSQCCNALFSEKCCDGACIPTASCCLPGGPVADGGTYEQCGVCRNGVLVGDLNPCLRLDPDGCTTCSAFKCVPGNNGEPCQEGFGTSTCGVCDGGLCHDRFTGGAPRKGCAGICCPKEFKCCSDNHCCPETTTCCFGTLVNGCCSAGTICCPSGQCARPPEIPCLPL